MKILAYSPIKFLIKTINSSHHFQRKNNKKIEKTLSASILRFNMLASSPPPPRFVIKNEHTDFPCIDLNAAQLIFNKKTQEYTYIQPSAPIKNLVISGGGAKGVMLPGVFKAFEEHFIKEGLSFRDSLETIVGSSVGALAAVVTASGMSSSDLINAAKHQDFKALLGDGVGPFYKDGIPLLCYLKKHIQSAIQKQLLAMGRTENTDVTAFVMEHLKKNGKNYPQEKINTLALEMCRVFDTIDNENPEKVSVTFSMMRTLRELNPLVFKDLTVTATCQENGKTYYFNEENTPNLDIAIAARASASLPVILKPVEIPQNLLLPGYPKEGNTSALYFVDGGYLNNIPVNAVHHKQNHPAARGIHGQNLQTLAIVFEDSSRSESEPSSFHNVIVKEHALYDSSSITERLTRDVFAKFFGGINTDEQNTILKEKQLEEIRLIYTERSIPLASSLTSQDFDQAKKDRDQYTQKGYRVAKAYLENHDSEAVHHTFKSFDALCEQLPKDEFQANQNLLEFFERKTQVKGILA